MGGVALRRNAASLACFLPNFKHIHDIADFPKPLGHFCSHGRRFAHRAKPGTWFTRYRSKQMSIIKTEPATAVCALERCGKRFTIGRRQNQHSSPGASPVTTARYCCNAHRQESYRIRRAIRAELPPSQRNTKHAGSLLHATVTTREIRKQNQSAAGCKKTPPGIVPDARWPGMYRVRLPDGGLSDMMNLTRAKEARMRMLATAARADDTAPPQPERKAA